MVATTDAFTIKSHFKGKDAAVRQIYDRDAYVLSVQASRKTCANSLHNRRSVFASLVAERINRGHHRGVNVGRQ